MAVVRAGRTNVGLVGLVYLVIGVVVAWQRGYLTVSVLKSIVSVVLAVLLWFLVLLGIDLHLR